MTEPMMELTFQDHLRWKVNNFFWGPRSNDYEKFEFEVGQMTREPRTWYQELVRAIILMVDTHGDDLALFYSGGFDSELILRVLVQKLEIMPKVHIIQFARGDNAHETKNAYRTCEELGVKPITWDHDVTDFVEKKQYLPLGLQYSCTQLAYLTVLEYARRCNQTVIMGGEVYVQKHEMPSDLVSNESQWYYIYREDEDGMTYRYSANTGHKIINEVFSYTPELLYRWLTNVVVEECVTGRRFGKLSLLSSKNDIFLAELPKGVNLSATRKFHGYEKLAWTNRTVTMDLVARLPRMQTARLPYYGLVEHLNGTSVDVAADHRGSAKDQGPGVLPGILSGSSPE
jgi:hypothetical protein